MISLGPFHDIDTEPSLVDRRTWGAYGWIVWTQVSFMRWRRKQSSSLICFRNARLSKALAGIPVLRVIIFRIVILLRTPKGHHFGRYEILPSGPLFVDNEKEDRKEFVVL